MTFKEKMNLLLHKNECIRVLLYDNTKRVTEHIVRVDNNTKSIEIKERRYYIDVDLIYYFNGLRTLTFHITNAEGVNPTAVIDPTKFRSDLDTAKRLEVDYNDKIMQELQVNSTEQKMTMQNMLVIMAVVIVGVLGIGLFFVYRQVQEVTDYIETNKDVIDLIKDYLLRNGG